MAKPSDLTDWDERKERVIGLGERSFHKSYYPQLRENLDRLKRFRTLLDRTTDFVVLIALPEAIISDANTAFGNLMGEPVKALIDRPFASLGLGKTMEVLDKLHQDMASWKPRDGIARQPSVFEVSFGDGHTWLELTCRTARLDEHFYGVIVGRDISDRKKAHEIMASLLAEKEALLDNALVGIAMLRNKQIVSCNRRFEEMFGHPTGAMIGRTIRELYKSDEDFDESNEAVYRSLLSGQGYASTMMLVRVDMSPFWCEMAVRAIDQERPQEGSIWIFTDVTERMQTEERLRESEETFRALVEGAADAYFVHGIEGNIIEVNRLACESLCCTREELMQMTIMDIDSDYDPEHAKQIWSRPELGRILTLRSHHRRKNGTRFPVEVRISATMIKGQQIFLALARDITAQVQAEEALRLAAKVYQDSSEAMLVCDENNHILTVNQAFTDITGYEADEVIGKTPSILRSDHHDAPFYQNMWKQILSKGSYKGEIWNKKKTGEHFAAQLTINTIASKDGVPHRYVGLLYDITEKKKSDERIWHQANFDALTGLPNRHLFRDLLQQQLIRAKRMRLPIALMLLDLDGFKHVNDTLGHDMGDVLLKEASLRLRNCMRETDTVARLGGDEFTIILTDWHDTRNIDRVARHILKSLSEPFQLKGEVAYVSASIGITLYPSDATEFEDLIRNADQAMYAAKQEGKNRYHYFTSGMQEAAMRRMRIINDMRGALVADQFELVYQPIVALSSGAIQKAEALIRWQHPRKGLIKPAEFISAAEDTGLIAQFGNWVFHEATKQVAAWREKYDSAFQISVNISPVQFKKEGIDPAVWLEHIKNLSLPGQGIVVEITEGLLLDASPKVTDQLLMLRDAGIEVALDDFGTGYSSLAYLKKFDIDYIKIDQTFVRALEANSDDMALCEAIIVMAHKLGLKVIAEGVETEDQKKLLIEAECDYAQGYLFSRPVSASEFERFLLAPDWARTHID